MKKFILPVGLCIIALLFVILLPKKSENKPLMSSLQKEMEVVKGPKIDTTILATAD